MSKLVTIQVDRTVMQRLIDTMAFPSEKTNPDVALFRIMLGDIQRQIIEAGKAKGMKRKYVMTFHVDVEETDVLEFVNAWTTKPNLAPCFGTDTDARLVDFHELPIHPDSPVR